MSSQRASLVVAVLGGLAFVVGDQLLYGHLGPGSGLEERVPEVVASRTFTTLAFGGALGPIGCVGLLFGALHLRTRFVEPARLLGMTTATLFAATFALASAVHAVWGAFALVVRSADHGAVAAAIWSDVGAYLDGLHLGTTVLGLATAALWMFAVATGRTNLPRASALANPGLVHLLLFVGGTHLPAPIGAPIAGSAFGLACALFFGFLLVVPRHEADAAR